MLLSSQPSSGGSCDTSSSARIATSIPGGTCSLAGFASPRAMHSGSLRPSAILSNAFLLIVVPPRWQSLHKRLPRNLLQIPVENPLPHILRQIERIQYAQRLADISSPLLRIERAVGGEN